MNTDRFSTVADADPLSQIRAVVNNFDLYSSPYNLTISIKVAEEQLDVVISIHI
jgi:hypothetical protein